MNASTVDIMVLLAVGVLGYLMRRYGIPVVPAIIGVILGPLAEARLRKALQISNGDWSVLWSTPFAIATYVVLAILGIGVAARLLHRRSSDPDSRSAA